MDGLAERGIDLSGIRISNRAQVVLPYHCLMDQLADDARGKGKVGTTHNGIGPCYVDRDNRIGIRVCDFIDKEEFAKRLKENLAIKNRELKLLYDHEPLDYDEILNEYNGYADRLRPYVCDTIALLDEEIKQAARSSSKAHRLRCSISITARIHTLRLRIQSRARCHRCRRSSAED